MKKSPESRSRPIKRLPQLRSRTIKRLNDHDDSSSRLMKYRNSSADAPISAPESTTGENVMAVADVVSEVRQWFENEGDLELCSTDEHLEEFFTQHFGEKEMYTFLFHPPSDQLGKKLHDHLHSFC